MEALDILAFYRRLANRGGRDTRAFTPVVDGLVPATPIGEALYPPDRGRRDKPGDDGEWAATRFAPLTV